MIEGLAVSIQLNIHTRSSFSEDIVPKPFDGEVERFTLMSLNEVLLALARGEFELNCAMT